MNIPKYIKPNLIEEKAEELEGLKIFQNEMRKLGVESVWTGEVLDKEIAKLESFLTSHNVN